MTHPNAFAYTFDNYIKDIKEKKKITPFTKVWTGR